VKVPAREIPSSLFGESLEVLFLAGELSRTKPINSVGGMHPRFLMILQNSSPIREAVS